LTVDEPELKIARCCSSRVQDNLSTLDMHHLICTSKGTEHFIEHLELGLFPEYDYLNALAEDDSSFYMKKSETTEMVFISLINNNICVLFRFHLWK